MSNHKRRLDALESLFARTDLGPPCDRCGAPGAVWRPAVWLGYEDELGTCEGCGRTMDVRLGRPVEPTMHTMILRCGTPPEGWTPCCP